jgi:hypothetical protein
MAIEHQELQTEQPVAIEPQPIASESADESQYETSQSMPSNIAEDNTPDHFKRRLGQQARRHEREKAELMGRISQLENSYSNGHTQNQEPDESQLFLKTIDQIVENRLIEKERHQKDQQDIQKISQAIESARQKYPDFDDLAGQYQYAPTGLKEALTLLDNADDVMFNVLKDPKEYNALMGMSAPQVIHRLTKISHQLGIADVSKAPSPVKPLTNSNHAQSLEKSVTEKRAMLRAQMRGRSARR